MEHPFFPTTTTRAEALRWLTISEKLLSARDLMGSKSFATRARDSDPTLSPADQILAVADTLLAGDRRIGNNQHDWYAILCLTPQQSRDVELIANQYRNLALLLNPQKNRFPFADQAFRLVVDAWSVLSDPSRKALYDKEIAYYSQPQRPQEPFYNPIPAMQQNFIFFGGNSAVNVEQPQVHVGGSSTGGVPSQFPQVHQVHTQAQVASVSGGPTREPPHNFMHFTSGSNLAFGSTSGSVSGPVTHEPVNRPVLENFPNFAGNVASGSGTAQDHANYKQKQPQENNTNASERPIDNVNVGEDVGDMRQDEEGAERVDVPEAEAEAEAEEEMMDAPSNEVRSSFWTACPYCYYMYEYPGLYVDCTLRCQTCKRAFQAVIIPSPPPIVDERDGYFCCWGFLPLGFSMENWEKNKGAASTWTPFSPMFTCPQNGSAYNVANKGGGRKSSAPRIYVDDDEVFVEVSDSSESDDDDWRANKKKKAKNVRGKGTAGAQNRSVKKVDKGKNVNDGLVSADKVETSNKAVGESSKKAAVLPSARKQPGRVAKNFGKLDLNVEFSNEAEEPPPRDQGNGPTRGEDDNIEGIGFFEGLDEFLSSLPILNVVADDKVVKAA